MSQSDTWFLIYGREKAKLVIASNQHYCSPAVPLCRNGALMNRNFVNHLQNFVKI